MWSDKDIDNAFRRLDPAEPDPTPFPLDAWLKLEAGLDQAVIDRAVRRRLWQFFAAEVAVVAVVGLGWSLWPAGGLKLVGAKAQTVASAILPTGKFLDTKRQQNQASVATPAAPVVPLTARNLMPAMPRPATLPAASAIAAATADEATTNGPHLPLAAKASAARFHSGNAQVAVLDNGAAETAGAIYGQSENASPFRAAGRKAEAYSLAGRASIAQAGAGTGTPVGTSAKKAARPESAIMDAETPGKGVGSQTLVRSRATSGEVAIAGAASPSGGRHEAALAAARVASERNIRVVATNIDGNAETPLSATTPTDPNLAPAPATAVALEQPNGARLPLLLAPAELAPAPLPTVVQQPRFYVGVVAAPDVSTVKFADVQAPRLNVGLTLEYRLGQRWRLATGVQRSTKAYYARREDYDWTNYPKAQSRTFSWVDGECTVIDVPLNLRYDAVVQAHGRWFGAAGLSSFFMHRENYSYDYLEGGTYKNWDLPGLVNANQHFFSVLNLSAGYEYGLGKHWRLQAEPYVKVPLAGVGAGKVKLLSSGLYFGLKYGF